MSHRGRLNVLANIVGKSYAQLFREFEGYVDPDSIQGSGDVKYHLGAEGVFEARSGASLPVSLAANPSHLEAVDPVVEGMARARMDQISFDPSRRFPVLPILMHGDAAFAGQGVVAETLNLSLIKGYRVGGTIHVIVNNQLGFTTPPESARSSEYCTDIAKTVQAPIFHVNGDDPEACVRVARLAFAYRQRFHKDVVIDMVCYRRHGHNEGDDPSYTQPLMYRTIDELRSVRKLYIETLVRRGDISLDEAEAALDDFQARLQAALDETRQAAPDEEYVAAPHPPSKGVLPHVDTGVDRSVLDRVYSALSATPEGFTVHPKLAKQLAARDKMFAEGEVDWALAEAFAFGSLLLEGTSVRLAGQDSRRGTFSHRHSTLVDYETGAEYVPLTHVGEPARDRAVDLRLAAERVRRARLRVRLLGEEPRGAGHVGGAVRRLRQRRPDHHRPVHRRRRGQVGSDLGSGHVAPPRLRGSGSRALLGAHRAFPHAVRRGQHPGLPADHGRAVLPPAASPDAPRRPQAADRDDPEVGTARQALALVGRFAADRIVRGVPDDASTTIDPSKVTRLVLASGKIGQEATTMRDELGLDVAVARVEQLYPWPYEAVEKELARFPHVTEIVWLQEEPENMGPWNSVKGRLYEALGDRYTVRRISRPDEASPATGSHAIHAQEQNMILAAAFAPLVERSERFV